MLKCSAAAQPAAGQITKSRSATGKHITNGSTLKITTYSVYRSLFASRRRRLPNEVSCCLFCERQFGALSHPFLSSPFSSSFGWHPLCYRTEVMPRAACAHGPAIIRHRWPPLGRKRRTADLVPRWVGISWVVGRRLMQVVD